MEWEDCKQRRRLASREKNIPKLKRVKELSTQQRERFKENTGQKGVITVWIAQKKAVRMANRGKSVEGGAHRK